MLSLFYFGGDTVGRFRKIFLKEEKLSLVLKDKEVVMGLYYLRIM